MKHVSLFLAGCALTSMSAFATTDNTTTFSYAQPDAEIYGLGWGDTVTHDVAIRISDPSYIGYKILGISVDIPYVEGCEVEPTGYGWLTSELVVGGKEFNYMNIPDITDPDDMPSGTVRNIGTADNPKYVLEIDFDEPYTITEEGVYVGYTITPTVLKSWTKKYPVALTKTTNNAGGLYMHAGSSSILGANKYDRWNDMSTAQGAVSTMRVKMEGSKKQNSAFLEPHGPVFGKLFEIVDLPVTLYNYGDQPINDFFYTCTDANHETNRPSEGVSNNVQKKIMADKVTLDSPLAPGESCDLSIPVMTYSHPCDVEMEIKVSSVNGQDNQYEGVGNFMMQSREWIPTKRVLAEEYTGTWCGWCPEHYVAIRQLEDKYHDQIVVATYHKSDQLQTIAVADLPNPSAGEPYTEFDRVRKGMIARNAEKMFLSSLHQLAPADISVELCWADESFTKLRPEVKVKFAEDANAEDYRIGYSLLEDKYVDETIKQRNFFYSGGDYTDPYYHTNYWDLFIGTTFDVKGIQYDGVTLLASNPKGIEGTIPNDVKTNDVVTWTTILDPEDGVCKFAGNESKYNKPVMLNRNNLRVAAYLIDSKTGKVVNAANSCYAADAKVFDPSTVGIDAVTTGSSIVTTEYYTLDGVRLTQAPEKGFFIEVTYFSDGKISTAKRLQ